jgi:hypothetical protein
LCAPKERRVYAIAPATLVVLRDELDRMWQRALARYARVANNSTAAAPRRKIGGPR